MGRFSWVVGVVVGLFLLESVETATASGRRAAGEDAQ